MGFSAAAAVFVYLADLDVWINSLLVGFGLAWIEYHMHYLSVG